MEGKEWYKSKTLWVNSVAVIAFAIQTFTGFAIDPQMQAGILGILNVILRFETSEPIKRKQKRDEGDD